MIVHVPARVAVPNVLPRAPRRTADPTALAATISDARANWPGRRTTTVLLSGCDFTCPYCFDPEHVREGRSATTVAQIAEQITRRGHSLEGVVVSGGEPTGCSGLRPLLEALAATRLPVKLDTNGSSPETLASLLSDGLIDFVSLDVKTTPQRYDRVAGSPHAWERVERSIAAVLESGVDHEFRTTCYPFALPAAEIPAVAARLVGGRRFVLQQFEPRRTLDPAAATVRPLNLEELRRVALLCSVYLPTLVRGA